MSFELQPQRILLPVKLSFMALTLALGLLFNVLPWRDVAGLPDILALIIIFWCVHQPRKMGISVPFTMGLFMDVANGTLMGQHALAYAVLAFGGLALSRRVLWFPLGQQALHVLVLLLLSQWLVVSVRLAAGAGFPGFTYFLGSFIAAALWPVATFVLLLPQRRPESVDDTRPI